MNWSNVRRQLLEAARKLRESKVLDAATKTLLRQIPVLGDFSVELWSSIDAGDEEKSAQLVTLLEAAAEREESFLGLQDVVRQQGQTLLATRASVDEIVGLARETYEVVVRIDRRLERLTRLTEARPVSEALRAAAMLEDEQNEVSGILRDVDAQLADAGYELSLESAYQLGLLYSVSGRYEDARRCFAAVTERKPDMAEAYAGLAMTYQLQASAFIAEENYGLASASLDRARSFAETALQYNSTDAGVLNQLGYTEKELAVRYQDVGRGDEAASWLDKARSHFKQVIGLDANDPGAHNGLGDVALLRGDYDEAVDECQRAVSLWPKYLFAQNDLAWALKMRAESAADVRTKSEDLRRFVQTAHTAFELDGDPEAGGTLHPQARETLGEAITEAMAWLNAHGL